MDHEAPRILAGRYEVGELIGRGGMAEVHIGHDARLGRTVAIKILRSDLARDPSFQARFRREAQSAAALNHPAIVAVYDTGEETYSEPSGNVRHVPFIVMEYVEGHTVRDILRTGHAVPIDEAVEIASGVLSALEYSHQAGIVHRDIKPANVMLTPTGAVKVMDFGIARAVADSAATMTQTQAVIGTAQYLSPEQARGESVDARSDLYSAGCLLFELLTGRPPFQGDSPVAVAYQHVQEAPPRPSSLANDIPETLDRVVLKSLAKSRVDRYGSAAEFRADLEAAAHGGHVEAAGIAAVAAAAAATPSVDDSATQVFGTAATQALPQPVQPIPATAGWAPTGAGTSPFPAVATPAPTPPQGIAQHEPDGRRRTLIWSLVAVAIVAIVAIVLILLLNQNNKEPETKNVTVPTIVGKSRTEVSAELAALNLKLVPELEDSTEPKDTALRSDPDEGASVPEGSSVTVWFSPGPSATNVPDLTGLDQTRAAQALKDAGLEVDTTRTEPSGTVELDRVTRTEPAADATAKKGDKIVLFISNGNTDVPDFTGEKRKAVEDFFAANPRVSASYDFEESADAKPGTVLRQVPANGQVKHSTVIEIIIAREPAPEVVVVPTNLVGMSQADAEAALRALNLVPKVLTEPSDKQLAGTVFDVPTAGTPVNEGDEVVIYVSTGPGPQAPPTVDPTTEPPADGEGDGDGGGDQG
ncbi:Stk1 family PASTA domain-containing Ser/Thr kinase [Sanguibacter sp. HDW7]|uniref:Stk1 family PASTA domain-containing Ser/Thr kinase n=1 Tax=Sanguibacter sp. HDW7 TaxID=2714931 RepID=UPI00140CEC69|nr:Stk1 family PASTA domain-containing Ser/Thr kinase [Sanguibacter sp. HDW7]QIK84761.1 Stk1 family PASTA domain-containing Ser/Thr kinase [Sanguibacter sp. HDW7]